MTKSLMAGFHLGVGGNQTGIGDLYYKKLAALGIPFVIMAADAFPAEAQELALAAPGVRNFVGYRRSTPKPDAGGPAVPPSGDPNVPRFGISAQQASEEHWAWHTAAHILPPEYDGRATYLLTINEPNKDDDAYVEWLADVEYYTCLKALAAGFRYAVFGWSGGTPEPRHWLRPQMARLLNLIEANPGRLAVAVHEYSWTPDTIWAGRDANGYTQVGRAHYNLLRAHPNLPLVITEFGWAERDAPSDVPRAIRETREVGELYARYPNYLGAAIWYLGPGFDNIHNTVNRYIAPLGEEIATNPIPDTTPPPDPDPTPPPLPEPNGPVLGTDVSRWQGTINFQQMADAGARYTFIKASDGLPVAGGGHWVDPQFAANWANSGRAHWVDRNGHVYPLLRGAYHFYRNTVDPIAQAAHFLSVVPSGSRGELPLVVDLEDESTLDAAVLRRFVDHVRQIDGRKVIIYTGGWWVRQYLRGDTRWLASLPLWHTPRAEPVPAPWTSILIDQEPSTLRGREFGCSEEGLDLDYFAGKESDLLKFASLPVAGRGRPREQYRRTYWLVDDAVDIADYLKLAEQAWEKKRTLGFSYDDAGIGALEKKTAVLFNVPANKHDGLRRWFGENYPGVNLAFTTIAAGEAATETNYTSHMIGLPREQYSRTYWCATPNITLPLWLKLAEQAWAERRTIGFSYDDAGIGDLQKRTAVLFNIPTTERQRYVGWFSEHYPGTAVQFSIVEEDTPPTPPGNGTAVIGLHASADPGFLHGGVAEVQEFQALKPGVIKVLGAIADYAPPGKAALADLADKNREAEYIVRAFLNFGDRRITPAQFFNDTISDVRRTINCLHAFGVPSSRIWIELHNEPNLRPEGHGISWASADGFGGWLVAVLVAYRAALPDCKFLYPGLSPGGDAYANGVLLRRDSARFLEGSRFAISRFDGVGVHRYWSSSYPMSKALAHLDTYTSLGKPVWVTEASNNTRPPAVEPTPRQYADQYVVFLNQLRQRPSVRGVTFFVASASNPEFHPEAWVVGGQSKGIAGLIAHA